MLCLNVSQDSSQSINFDASTSTGFDRMNSCAWAAIFLALEAYCVSRIALGQAPSQSLGADESMSPQQSMTVVPGSAPAVRNASGQGNPLSSISLESLRATRQRPLFSVTRRPAPSPISEEVV